MKNFKRFKLGEICEIGSSTRIFANEYKADGVPFYRSKEIIELGSGKLDVSEKLFISKDRFEQIKAKYTVPQKNDILIAAIGANLGESYIVKDNREFYFKDGNIIWLKNFKINVKSKYIYYWMKSNDFAFQYKNKSIGAAQKALTIDSLKEYLIPVPDLETQIKVIITLEQLDKKIMNNNKINNNLEELMQTLYQRWFIEFNFPNKDGKPYKSSGGKMVWNEELKQERPEEWKVENLYKNTLSSVIKNGIEKFDKKIYLETADINNDCISNGNEISFNDRPSRANMQPRLNSVWFAKMKNSVKHLSLSESSNTFVNKYILSTGMYGLQCDRKTFPYIHSFINSIYFEPTKDKLAHGATQQAVNDNDIKNIKIICPSNYIIEEYSNRTYSILEEKNLIQEENRHLTELRDFLLPMLMNGQINVDDVEI